MGHRSQIYCRGEEKSVAGNSKVEFEIGINERNGKEEAINVTGLNGDYCIEQTKAEKKGNRGIAKRKARFGGGKRLVGIVISFDKESRSGIIKVKGTGDELKVKSKDYKHKIGGRNHKDELRRNQKVEFEIKDGSAINVT